MYSECLKSKLVWISDTRVTVWFPVKISDKFGHCSVGDGLAFAVLRTNIKIVLFVTVTIADDQNPNVRNRENAEIQTKSCPILGQKF